MIASSSFCPKCSLIPSLYITAHNLHIKCSCGYDGTMSFKDYLNKIFFITKNGTIKDSLHEIQIKISKGSEHLKGYFTNLKDEAIASLNNQIAKISRAFEESFTRNNDILILLNRLIDNYNNDQTMLNNITTNSNINIYKCHDGNIVDYFTKYTIIKIGEEIEPVDKNNITVIKTLDAHSEGVNCLLLLFDNRIASCSNDNTIKIFDPSNDYQNTLTLNHNGIVSSICQVENGTLVSSSYDKSIKFWEVKKNSYQCLHSIEKAHDDWLRKVISLSHNQIASCSGTKKIKIWKCDAPYSDIPIATLTGHETRVSSLLYISNKNLLVSGSYDRTLRVWELSTFQCAKIINGVYCHSANSLCLIDNNRVIVGGESNIYIVNITEGTIEKVIEDINLGYVFSFEMLRDKRTVMCGTYSSKFYLCDIDNFSFCFINSGHMDNVNDIKTINCNTLMSCSEDETIQIIKY